MSSNDLDNESYFARMKTELEQARDDEDIVQMNQCDVTTQEGKEEILTLFRRVLPGRLVEVLEESLINKTPPDQELLKKVNKLAFPLVIDVMVKVRLLDIDGSEGETRDKKITTLRQFVVMRGLVNKTSGECSIL